MAKANIRELMTQIFNRNGVIAFGATNAALAAMGQKKIAKTTYFRNKSRIMNGGLFKAKPPEGQAKPAVAAPTVNGPGSEPKPLAKPGIVPGVKPAEPLKVAKPLPAKAKVKVNPPKAAPPPPKVSMQAALLLLKDLTKDVEAEKITKVRQAIHKVGGLANFDNLSKFLATLRE